MSGEISIWRIASQGLTWKANDLSGNGAARYPGRWNSLDRPIVYSSSWCGSPSPATTGSSAGFLLCGSCVWDSAPTPEHAEDWVAVTRAWGGK